MDVVLVGLPGSGKSVDRPAAGEPARRRLRRPRRADRAVDRPVDPGDLRGGRRGRVPGARAGGDRRARPGRPGPGDPAGDRDRRRRGRRSAQPLGALPRPAGRSGSTAARRSSPSACAARRTSGRSSPGATRSARSATSARGASGSTPPPTIHQSGVAEVQGVVDAVEDAAGAGRRSTGRPGRRCCAPTTPIGRIVLGDGIAAGALAAELEALGARRAILVSEPGAWEAVGERDRRRPARAWLDGRAGPAAAGRGGQAAGRRRGRGPRARRAAGRARRSRSSRSAAARSATRPGSSRRPTCAASRSSRCRPRSSPRSTRRSAARPASTCPRARTSSARSTSRRPIVIDVALLRTLPERQLRAALGEAVKMAALGDERLFELLESDGPAIARGDTRRRFGHGAVAEVVERCGLGQGRGRRRRRARATGRAAAGSPSTSVTRSATRSRRPPATATCSTARPSPTACGRPPDRRRGRA